MDQFSGRWQTVVGQLEDSVRQRAEISANIDDNALVPLGEG